MKVMIFGGNGQLGSEFQKLFRKSNIIFRAYDYPDGDISDYNLCKSLILDYKPDIIINTAAYNQVDKAETDWISAYRVNAIGSYNLAVICNDLKIRFIHYSTDYIFDGRKSTAYDETDAPNPLNEYGKSKLLGEGISTINSDILIFRLSWVYGGEQSNFVSKLIQWSREYNELKIVTDEISVPSSVSFIAHYSLMAIKQQLSGTFHLTPQGYCSRYEFATEILKNLNIQTPIVPAKITDFGLPAVRPQFSAMNSSKLSTTLNVKFPEWNEDLADNLRNYTV